MVWKISEEELKKQPKVVQERLKDREVGIRKPPRPAQGVDRYRAPPKSRWESIREGILKGGKKAEEVGKKGVGKFQEFARNHPINQPENKERGERKERREPREKAPHGRVSQRDIYKNGVLVEKLHYGPSKPPKQPRQPRRRREDPIGGIGKGMHFSDFLPSNTGVGLGGMMHDPYAYPPEPKPRRKGKKGRRQPREQGTYGSDYLERMNTIPDAWKGLGF